MTDEEFSVSVSLRAIITVRNEVAKVMFLQASVCLQGGGGVCLSACWVTTPLEQTTPAGADTPPPEIRSLLRTVRILLECILVVYGIPFDKTIGGRAHGSVTNTVHKTLLGCLFCLSKLGLLQFSPVKSLPNLQK